MPWLIHAFKFAFTPTRGEPVIPSPLAWQTHATTTQHTTHSHTQIDTQTHTKRYTHIRPSLAHLMPKFCSSFHVNHVDSKHCECVRVCVLVCVCVCAKSKSCTLRKIRQIRIINCKAWGALSGA